MNASWAARRPVLADVLLLLLIALVFIAAGIGLRNPWPADEPVYALISRDMLASGNWLIPMAGGDFYQDKPPLFFWMIASSYLITGSEQVGFLLPSLIAGLVTVLLVYDLGRRLWSRRVGLLAGVLLLATVQFALQARRAQIDAALTMWTTLCLYCLLRTLLLDGKWTWYLAAGAAAGFGVMTKIVGFLPFVVFLPYLYARWQRWQMPRTGLAAPGQGAAFWSSWWSLAWPWALACLACAAVAMLWIGPLLLHVAHSGDPQLVAYRDEVLLTQTFGRFVTPWHHQKPFYYYIQVMLTSWLPLVLLLPWLVPRWWSSLRAHDARILLPLGFAVLCVVFFSASSGKRDVYILPALPAVALCAAPYLEALLQRRGVQLVALVFTCILTVAGLAAYGAALLHYAPLVRAADEIDLHSLLPLLILGLAGVALLLLCRLQRAPQGLLGMLGVAWLIYGLWIGPDVDAARSSASFVANLERRADPQRELGLLEYHEQLLWNIRRTSINFGHRRFREGPQESWDAARWLNEDPTRQLLVAEETLAPCYANVGSKLDMGLSSSSRWYLVTGPADPACAAKGVAGRAIRYVPASTRTAP